jgi:CBS domain-containing protein
MSTNVATIEVNASLSNAVELMEGRRLKRLPVVDGNKVVGMIARADFVHALALFVRQPYEEGFVDDAEIKRRIEAEMQANSGRRGSPRSISSSTTASSICAAS